MGKSGLKVKPRLEVSRYAAYLYLNPKAVIDRAVEIYHNVYADFDSSGNLVGIEFVVDLQIINLDEVKPRSKV